jgi:hypothetical protein
VVIHAHWKAVSIWVINIKVHQLKKKIQFLINKQLLNGFAEVDTFGRIISNIKKKKQVEQKF